MKCNGAQDYLNVGRFIAQMGQPGKPIPIPIEDTALQPNPGVITIEDLEPNQTRQIQSEPPAIETLPNAKRAENEPRTPGITYPLR